MTKRKKTLGEELIQSAKEAKAIARGEMCAKCFCDTKDVGSINGYCPECFAKGADKMLAAIKRSGLH